VDRITKLNSTKKCEREGNYRAVLDCRFSTPSKRRSFIGIVPKKSTRRVQFIEENTELKQKKTAFRSGFKKTASSLIVGSARSVSPTQAAGGTTPSPKGRARKNRLSRPKRGGTAGITALFPAASPHDFVLLSLV
jgi:hypothetical protein